MNFNQYKKNILQSLIFLISLIVVIIVLNMFIGNFIYIFAIATLTIGIYIYKVKTKDYLNNFIFIGIPSILIYVFLFIITSL